MPLSRKSLFPMSILLIYNFMNQSFLIFLLFRWKSAGFNCLFQSAYLTQTTATLTMKPWWPHLNYPKVKIYEIFWKMGINWITISLLKGKTKLILTTMLRATWRKRFRFANPRYVTWGGKESGIYLPLACWRFPCCGRLD